MGERFGNLSRLKVSMKVDFNKKPSIINKIVRDNTKRAAIETIVTVFLLLVALLFFYYSKGKNDFFVSKENKLTIVGSCAAIVFLCLLKNPIPKWLKWVLEWGLMIWVPFFIFDNLEPILNDFSTFIPEARNYNIFLIFAFVLVIYGLFQDAGVALLIACIGSFIFYFAGYFTFIYRGTPLLFADILSTRTAVGVLGGYQLQLNAEFMVTFFKLIVFVAAGFYISDHKKKWFVRIIFAVVSLTVGIGAYSYYINSDYLDRMNFSSSAYTPYEGAAKNGLLLNAVIVSHQSKLEEPEGYSISKVNGIIEKYTTEKTETTDIDSLPNIIVVMNESFTDLEYLEVFETSEETMPFFKSLSDNCVKGTLISSILGGNTPNSEFEFLTGNSLAFLPQGTVVYQQFIDDNIPTLASNLKSLGYDTTAIHIYNPVYFDRARIYPLLGFDEFINETNLPDDFTRETYREDDMTTDQCFYNMLKYLYEHNESGKKTFSFSVTIQNHGGYNHYIRDVRAVNLSEMEQEWKAAYVDEYATLILKSDEAFEDLISYFSQVEEPTVILMYGDHQPFFTSQVYEHAYRNSSYSNEEIRYMQAKTPFIIWANYDIEEATYDEISINYLGALLSETAGLPMSDYFKYLNSLRKELPVVCAIGFKDSKGNYFTDYKDSEYAERIREYEYLQYYYLKGDSNNDFYK